MVYKCAKIYFVKSFEWTGNFLRIVTTKARLIMSTTTKAANCATCEHRTHCPFTSLNFKLNEFLICPRTMAFVPKGEFAIHILPSKAKKLARFHLN